MRILVAGATGVIGRRLVPLLARAGQDVWGTTRRADRAAKAERLGWQPSFASWREGFRLA
jgi:uncharacterized protein YbjT (DUF2867 family)